MRKVALLATTAVAALGITSPAWAVNADQTISIKLKPSKAGTKKKPANVKITVADGHHAEGCDRRSPRSRP